MDRRIPLSWAGCLNRPLPSYGYVANCLTTKHGFDVQDPHRALSTLSTYLRASEVSRRDAVQAVPRSRIGVAVWFRLAQAAEPLGTPRPEAQSHNPLDYHVS